MNRTPEWFGRRGMMSKNKFIITRIIKIVNRFYERRKEKKKMNELTILGSKWRVLRLPQSEDPILQDVDGYCDWSVRKIVVCWSGPADSDTNCMEDLDAYRKKVLRHEIVHAFLKESGLMENSLESTAWAQNEEMVDWFAAMGERIYEAWKEADAI